MNKFLITDIISSPILNTYYQYLFKYCALYKFSFGRSFVRTDIEKYKILFFRQFFFTLSAFYSIPFLLYFVEFSFKKFVYVKLFGNSFKLSNSKYTSFKLVYISPSESSLDKSVLLVQVKLPPAFYQEEVA